MDEAVGHSFSSGETYSWLVTASSGEQITIYSTDYSYSPDIYLIEVYSGDASSTELKANAWTYVKNLDKTSYVIEGLELDTEYEVQVQAIGDDGTLSDWTKPDNFITLSEEPFIPVVHILGEVNDQAWSPFAGTKMEYDPETEIYTATVFVWEGGSFGFSTEIDDNEDMGGWNYIEPFRFGPVSDVDTLLLTNELLGQTMPLTFDNFANVRVRRTGEYEVTVSLENNYIIIGLLSTPEHIYALGDVNHDGLIDVEDVTMLIGMVLGTNNNGCEICADMDGNGYIDVEDVTLLINKLLGNN